MGVSGSLLLSRSGDTEEEHQNGGTQTARSPTTPEDRSRGRDDSDPESLRSIAKTMDAEKPARRLRGNGPPFADDRPSLYDKSDLGFSKVVVDTDPASVNPPRSRVVSGGPVKLDKLDRLVTYNGIRYLDAPPPGKPSLKPPDTFSGTPASGTWEMYRYNLLFSYRNAYDLGMVNRSDDNKTIIGNPDSENWDPYQDGLTRYTDKGILESHRFPEGSEDHRSLRSIVERHSNGVRHRVLWQNAKLPANRATNIDKAKAFGRRFADAGYDVVGLCEVYSDDLLAHMQSAYEDRYTDTDAGTDRQYGLWRLHDLGVLLGKTHSEESGIKRTLGNGASERYDASGPKGGASVNLEGWQRASVHVPDLPGNPAFELFVTHFQGVGSALPQGAGTREDAKQHAKLDQLAELTRVIEEFQSGPNNHRPILVMGDLNIHSLGKGQQYQGGLGAPSGVKKGQYYSNLMHRMHSVGMQDAWLTYGGPATRCKLERDSYTCKSFIDAGAKNKNENKDKNENTDITKKRHRHYRKNRIDYVFIEIPRERHDLHLDVTRMRKVQFQDDNDLVPDSDTLSDHDGIGFELLTSPAE